MSEDTVATRTRLLSGQQLLLLLSLFLGHALMHCFQQGWYVVLPSVKTSFGISLVQYGAIESTRAFSGGLMNLPAALVSDLFKSRWVLILAAGLVGLGLAFFLLGTAPNYPVVLVAASLLGISTSTWHPPAISTLSATFPGRIGLALSVHGLGGNLGNTIGPLGLGLLIGAIAWQTASQILAIPLIALAVVLWLVLRNSPGREGPSVGGEQYWVAIKELLKNRVVIGLAVSQGVLSMGTFTILAFFSLYCQQDLGFSASKAGFYFALLMVSGIFSQPVLGYLSDRIGRKSVIVPSLFLLGGFTILIVWAGDGVGLMLVALCIGLFIYSLNAVIQAATLDATEEQTGAMTIGILFTSSALFASASPTIAGAVSSAYGTPSVFLYSGGFIVLAALLDCLLPIGRAKRSGASKQ